MFDNIYHNRKVLITGHTGFKGSWMALWLSQLGAKLIGYSLDPPTQPNHFQLLELNIKSITGDVRDLDKLSQVFHDEKPEIVFHLAAQPIVRISYRSPVETFSSNVMGTVNVLEAAKGCDNLRGILIVTSDKCYENREWPWAYREIDELGGHDPYSASKGCAELITRCWRQSFFNPDDYGKTHQMLLASVRAGNVIGGGDWAPDRLIPDIVRAVSEGKSVEIRNPQSIRPWQYVLEPLSGYLLLGQKLLEGRKEFAEPWNFGPPEEEKVSVMEIFQRIKSIWPQTDYRVTPIDNQPHEAGMLQLSCAKARSRLGWLPVWNSMMAIEKTIAWYKAFYGLKKILSLECLKTYIADAQEKKLAWAEI
jgi:CDP-glucose 4,6-dehydratase